MAEITGLREQIKANATDIFPQAAATYATYCINMHLSFSGVDAFEVWIRPVGQTACQALLLVKSAQKIVATGDVVSRQTHNSESTEHALRSLLDTLIDRAAERLAAAMGDDGKAVNPNKIKWVSSETK